MNKNYQYENLRLLNMALSEFAHDFATPFSAIYFGIELSGTGSNTEVSRLLIQSLSKIRRQLEFYRETCSKRITSESIRSTAINYFTELNTELQWPSRACENDKNTARDHALAFLLIWLSKKVIKECTIKIESTEDRDTVIIPSGKVMLRDIENNMLTDANYLSSLQSTRCKNLLDDNDAMNSTIIESPMLEIAMRTAANNGSRIILENTEKDKKLIVLQ
jgi:hypothetical protein